MSEISKDFLELITQLIPGFLTAWVVYGLTTYTKPSQFERVVQALIYSVLVNFLVVIVESICNYVGRFVQFGVWNKSTQFIVSTATALILGLVFSYFMRNDAFFRFARALGLTSRTPYPSEWYGAFARTGAVDYGVRSVVLYFRDSRRLVGYPVEWPTEPTSGHFRLMDAAWIDDNNEEIRLNAEESILVEANQVEMVAFLKTEEEYRVATKES